MKVLVAVAGMWLLTMTQIASAAVSDAEFQQLKEMFEEALDRISELEQQQAARPAEGQITQANKEPTEASAQITALSQQVADNQAALEQMSWAERIKFSGDFRYRYQTEEKSGLSDAMNIPEADSKRNRQRIRARAALTAEVSETVDAVLGVATGGDDPVSSNQTLGGAGSSKDIKLDLAYFDWQFDENANLYGGKFKNKFVDAADSGFLWDSDWRPEGFDVYYEGDTFYANFLGTWLEADSNSGSSFNYGGQVGATPQVGGAKLDVGVSYFKIKAEGVQCFNAPSDGRGDDCQGNTLVNAMGMVDPMGELYFMDYAPVEIYGVAAFDAATPFGFFFDFAKNVDAKSIPNGPSAGKKLDTAYLAGGYIGKAKKKGEWQVKAYYQEKEADSVLGLLTDSDFAGGGTDSKGFVVQGKYMLSNSTYLAAKYLAGEKLDSNGYDNGSLATSNPFDNDIVQLDVQFKYK